MPVGRLRVKLKAYDYRLIDEAAMKILETAIATGAKIVGPIPLPTKKTRFAVVPSTSRGIKNAQEHYEMLVHKRLIDLGLDERALRLVMRVPIPEGLNIEIEIIE